MIKPSKEKIELWNRLVKEVFNHPRAELSIFVYELLKRRILGTKKKEYRTKSLCENRGYGKEIYNSDKDFGISDIGDKK